MIAMQFARGWLIAVVVPLALFAPRRAEACFDTCDSPSTGLSPPSGTVLPAQATVYAFVPVAPDEPAAELGLEVEGARFTVGRVATMPSFAAVRIDLAATGRSVVIRWHREDGPTGRPIMDEARYPIGTPEASTATAIDVEYGRASRACEGDVSHAIHVRLTGTAIAYRLDWSDGSSDVVPSDLRVLSRDGNRYGDPAHHTVEIGRVGWVGDTVGRGRLATLRRLDVTALFVDGTERLVGSAPAQLRDPHELDPVTPPRGALVARLPEELVDPGAREIRDPPRWTPRGDPPRPRMTEPFETARAAPPFPPFPPLGAAALVAAIAGFALWRRGSARLPSAKSPPE